MNIVSTPSTSTAGTAWEYPSGARQDELTGSSSSAYTSQGDQVRFNSNYAEATFLDDTEVESVLEDSMRYITGNPESAMYAHQGLDASRVAMLLA